MTFDVPDSTGTWSCADGSPAAISCTSTIGSVVSSAGSTQKFAVKVNGSVPAGTNEIDITATISSSTTTDTAAVTVPMMGVAPGVSVAKTATDVNGGSPVPGDMLEYTTTVSNKGNAEATNVVLTDPIPSNTTYVANSTTFNTTLVVASGDGTMPYTGSGAKIRTIPLGGDATIVSDVAVNNLVPAGTTEINNTATATEDNFSSTAGSVTSPLVTGLTISKQFDSSHISSGETTSLTFTISNPAGNPSLTGLTFTIRCPTAWNSAGNQARRSAAGRSP